MHPVVSSGLLERFPWLLGLVFLRLLDLSAI
jgi:hypothetical protein